MPAFTSNSNIPTCKKTQVFLPSPEQFTLFFDTENSNHLTACKNVGNVKVFYDYEVPSTAVFNYKGDIDASTNPNYPAAISGDVYRVSVAGRVGGVSGIIVTPNDLVIAFITNAGGTQAAVGTSWLIVQANLALQNSTGLNTVVQVNLTNPNTITGEQGFAIGNDNNDAGDRNITGGDTNTINALSQNNNVVGQGNTITGSDNIIGGGSQTVVGGQNIVSGSGHTVTGDTNNVSGTSNTVTADDCNVSGNTHTIIADKNNVSGRNHSVSGGENSVSGLMHTVGGTNNNVSGGLTAPNLVAGNDNNISGSDHQISNTSVGNDVSGLNHSVNGSDNIIGGLNHTHQGDYNIIAGQSIQVNGDENNLSGNAINVTGDKNTASGINHTINGEANSVFGTGNDLLGDDNIVSGRDHQISGDQNIVTGFTNTITTSEQAGIIGGNNNTITGDRSVILGGHDRTEGADNMTNAQNIRIDNAGTSDATQGQFYVPGTVVTDMSGEATLIAGQATILNTNIVATSLILLSRRVVGGTPGHLSYVRNAGASFVINSSEGADTSTISYMIIQNAAQS